MNTDALIRIDEALRKVEAAHYDAKRAKAITPAVDQAEKKLARVFREQGKLFLERFAVYRGRFTEALSPHELGPLFAYAFNQTRAAMTDAILEAVKASLQAGADGRIADFKLDISFNLKNPRAVAYVQSRGAENVKNIDDTTQSYIKTVIEEGVDEGWSYDKMAQKITDRYEEFAIGQPQEHIDSRAHLVAVQESAMAYERGNRLVVDDLTDAGLEMEKSWLTVGDDRVSDECAGNEEEGWIPAEQPHSSGAGEPPGHVACRCTELYRIKGSAYE